MDHPDKAIICGTCNLPVTGPTAPEPHSTIVCIGCGARDTYEEVWKVCLKHIQHRLRFAGEDTFFKWRIKD